MRHLAIILACAGLLAATEPPAFRAEGLSVSLRRPIGEGQPRPDHRLTLIADLARGMTVLRLSDPCFTTIEADTGERLGLLVRPSNRTQNIIFDRRVERERVLRLSLDLTPPRDLVRSLGRLSGSVRVVSGVGPLRTVQVALASPATGGVPVDGLAGCVVSCDDLGEGRIALLLPPVLAERCARVTFTDPAGATAVARSLHAKDLPDGGLRLTCDLAASGASQAAIAWFPETASATVAIDLPHLTVPGGIPGLGEVAAAVAPPRPPPVPKDRFLLAVFTDDRPTLDWLLATDRRPLDLAQGDGRRPLHLAAAMRSDAVLRALLAAGADPTARSKDGMLPLDLAIAAGDPVAVRLLLAHGGDLQVVHPATGWTLLHRAVAAGSPEVVDLLLGRGADPRIRASDGRDALDLARDQGQWTLLRRMLGNR